VVPEASVSAAAAMRLTGDGAAPGIPRRVGDAR
jgi:hypothetical protein